jgi:hypothetical protein
MPGPVSTSFKGGIRLARTLKKMAHSLATGESVKVGFTSGARYPDGVLVSVVAMWNEFGTKTAPARPAIRTMIADKSPTWGASLARILVNNRYHADTALKLMGEGMKAQMVTAIRDWETPPNAPSTIAKKGFDKPWIETSFLIDSVDYEVVSK